MRILARVLTSLALSLGVSYAAFAQELSPVDRVKLRRAERTADRFVARFRQTLNFKTVWREFQVSDASCNYRINGPWDVEDYERLKLDDALVGRLYIAYMDCMYLSFTYRLGLVRITADEDYDLTIEKLLPEEIRAAEKKLVDIEVGTGGRPRPQNAEEAEAVVAELHRLANVWRRQMPRNVMRSAVWRANMKYLLSKEGIAHLGVESGGHSEFCIPDSEKYYIVDRGLFYFYFIEKDGRMKVVGFGMGN
jgi:hypothetical protein